MDNWIAGAVAGMSVDFLLFPLDTIKTRLQSATKSVNLYKTIYSGLSSTMLGSAPSASAFFVTYEYLKRKQDSHAVAASCAEVTACVLRVPTEIVKQRLQHGQYISLRNAITSIRNTDGVFGFYRGFAITLFRDVPFAMIQFPIYEALKNKVARFMERDTRPLEAAFCGSIAGSIAAALTTPLDVIKTRIMLEQNNSLNYNTISNTVRRILHTESPAAFFAGIAPRIMWISVGGFIFLGVYEKVLYTIKDYKD